MQETSICPLPAAANAQSTRKKQVNNERLKEQKNNSKTIWNDYNQGKTKNSNGTKKLASKKLITLVRDLSK